MNKNQKNPGRAERLLQIIRLFSERHFLCVSEIMVHFETKGFDISRRLVQGDLQLLNEYDLARFEKQYHSENRWDFIGFRSYGISSIQLHHNSLLSYYILKAHLEHFRDTVIDEGISELEKELERLAPGQIFSSQDMFIDRNIGHYDYSLYDPIIRKIINFIVGRRWMKVYYETGGAGKINEYNCQPRKMFEYQGLLYVIVFIHGKRDEHRALAIHNIHDAEECSSPDIAPPDFDHQQWKRERFGVFHGKPVTVRLKISADYWRFFKDRNWHYTQKFYEDEAGNNILEMIVPIVPDFKAWLMSWGNGIKVIEPKSLLEELKENYKAALSQYEK